MQKLRKPSVGAHPRRAPAEESVSLRKGPVLPTVNPQRPPVSHRSSGSSSLEAHRSSSGETSNVDNWFEKSNINVDCRTTSLNDSDPPFSFEATADDTPPQDPTLPPYSQHIPLRPYLHMNDSCGSSSEDYRSIIDDLTIQNKKLKKKLKRLERASDAHLQPDRLFEVKIHALPPDKKRELQETLRRFTADLHKSPTNVTPDSSSQLSNQPRLTKPTAKPTSSLTSTRIADSGYGSLATSAKPPTPASATQLSHASNKPSSAFDRSNANARDRNIQSYLHDIPEGLLPKQPNTLSEKAKKKLVVRRLEQIFGGGRGSEPGLHQQPLQQQEVSDSAAKADQSNLEALGQKAGVEGIREARIMESDTEDPMEPASLAKNSSEESTLPSQPDCGSATAPAPEQRPTRPLDLDPHRAQVPAENIEYIRHLGFLDSDGGPKLPTMDDQNWIYLNLLVNMAQLHTINVTTDFVKMAIAEYSSKIELSSDGRKVRWKEQEGNMLSSDTSPDIHNDSPSSRATDEERSGNKRPRPSYLDVPRTGSGQMPKRQAVQDSGKDKFSYTPLFPHQDSSDDDDSDSSMDDNESLDSSPGAPMEIGESSAGGAKTGRALLSKTHRNDGPIVFYNNATFCSDLSGDTSKARRPGTPGRYSSLTSAPLGTTPNKVSSGHSSVKGSESSTFDVSELSSSLDLASRYKMDLDFPSGRSSPRRVSFAEPEQAITLEASGVGGVTPQDNMTITVVRRREPSSSVSKAKEETNASKLSGVLSGRSRGATRGVSERVISTRHRKIDPSPLPPATLHFGVEDSESDSDSDAGSDDSSADLRQRLAQAHGLSSVPGTRESASSTPSQKHRSGLMGQESSDESMDDPSNGGMDSSGADDQSLDFLAPARAVDPAAVMAKEREYDADVAERLAEEIPAGSSAATAGGGSGFTSPSEVVKRQEDGGGREDDEGEEASGDVSISS